MCLCKKKKKKKNQPHLTFISLGIFQSGVLDVGAIDARLRHLDRQMAGTAHERKKTMLEKELGSFLAHLPEPTSIDCASPHDVRRFLVAKDSNGRTKVHSRTCPFLGRHGASSCPCPRRLASGTVEVLIGHLRSIFERSGRGRSWCPSTPTGNPACAPEVTSHLKAIQKEQSAAHVTARQAKPLFADKLRAVVAYIEREIQCPCTSSLQKFILLRDQAFLKLQFFAGDRASDLGRLLTQELRQLQGNRGFMIRHTSGKSFSKDRTNLFAIHPCQDGTLCPVEGLHKYFRGAAALGIPLGPGCLFRLTKNGQVLEEPITYDAIYERLKHYLNTLGIDEGESPHSLRGGCAVTLRAASSGTGADSLMQHIGWATTTMPRRYSRADHQLAGQVAETLSHAVGDACQNARVESQYSSTDYDSLPVAFP